MLCPQASHHAWLAWLALPLSGVTASSSFLGPSSAFLCPQQGPDSHLVVAAVTHVLQAHLAPSTALGFPTPLSPCPTLGTILLLQRSHLTLQASLFISISLQTLLSVPLSQPL